MTCKDEILYERGMNESKLTEKSSGGLKLWSWQSSLSSQSLKAVICGTLLLAILSLFLGCKDANAGLEIDGNQAVRAIIGEAEGEPYIGKLALAEAIRNRGTLQGVYGLKSPRVAKAPAWVWTEAMRAWRESADTNLVKGADHWESTDFKTPYWAKKMEVTATIGKHKFYRVKK